MANASIDPFLPVMVAPRETANSARSSGPGPARFDDHIRRATEPPDPRDDSRPEPASTRRKKTGKPDDPTSDSQGSSTDDRHTRDATTPDAANPPSETEEKDNSQRGDTVEISNGSQQRDQADDPSEGLLEEAIATDPLAQGELVEGEQVASGGQATDDDGTDLPSESNGQPKATQPTAAPTAESAQPEEGLPGQADPTSHTHPLTDVTEARTDGPPTGKDSNDGNPPSMKGEATTPSGEESSPLDLSASATGNSATPGGQSGLAENGGADEVAPQSGLANNPSTAPSTGDTGNRADQPNSRDRSARRRGASTENLQSLSDQPSTPDGQQSVPISQIAAEGLPAAGGNPEDPSLPSQLDNLSPQSKGVIDRLSVGRSVQPSETMEEDARTTPVDRARFVQRVGGALQLAHQRDGRVQLRLSPPELGSLRIEISVKQGVLTATLETETTAARNVLLDNLPALRERLAEQEIRIEQFDVDVRRDGQQEPDNRAMQDRRRGPGQDGSTPARSKEPESSDHPNPGMPVHHSHATDRVLDGLDVVV